MITRDAKIGMLVVLAFCLIVGILLSEHMTTTAEPAQAQLAQAGQHVRQATNAPTPTAPMAANATTIDADPQPKTTVVTRDTLDAPTPTSKIELGHASGGEMKVIRVDSAPDAVAGAVQVAVPAPSQPAEEKPAAVAQAPVVSKTPAALDALAKQHGLELVPVATNASTSPKVIATNLTTDAKGTEPKSLAPKNAKVKEVIALNGDTLSKLAGRTLGANTPQNRQAIIDLNPSLQKNAERVLVGAKYLVPADAWAAALNVDPTAPAPKPLAAKPQAAAQAPAAPAAPAMTLYEVKPGDSLWKLAAGDANAVEQIKTLNADVLKGAETVKVGMKLKLPAKPATKTAAKA